jgi:hypothetical protein
MNLSIYKPNPSGTGCAFSFQIGADGKTGSPSMYMKAIKQHSWDAGRRIGNFSNNKDDPTKNLSLKFNESECGEIVSAIANRHEFSTFHSFEENKTSIKFSPWDKKSKNDESVILPAFGITVTRNGSETFKVPLDPGETIVITELLRYFFVKVFEFRAAQMNNKKAPF